MKVVEKISVLITLNDVDTVHWLGSYFQVFCDTSPHYRTNCRGRIRSCHLCPYRYCEYHYRANKSAAELIGGHVCNVSDGHGVL